MMELTPQRQKLLQTEGHLLVLGGPGSGKTTIALRKAGQIFESKKLQSGQKVLFLSFARATVARIMEQSRNLLFSDQYSGLEINTYHGFSWNILRSHGYLLNPERFIRLFPPPEAAARLSHIDPASRDEEKRRLFETEGLLHFDLFAQKCSELLSRSQQLLRIITDTYPVIIVDEFQDTNASEWAMIQTLGKHSTIIALADAEQRIYEFRGADPARIGEFIQTFGPSQFDFGAENHRSDGTDIATFGNDLLSGANKGKVYRNVKVHLYPFYRGFDSCFTLKTKVFEALKRLKASGTEKWSIAILVPTKKLMLSVSDYFSSSENGLSALFHDVALDQETLELTGFTCAVCVSSLPPNASNG